MSDLTDFYSAMGSKQRDQRVRRFYTDQHGRRFFAWADKDNQRPIGEFVLADTTGRFETPKWLPPMTFIEWPDADSLTFAWAYAALGDALGSITAEWYGEAQRIARLIPDCSIPDIGGAVDEKLLGVMGGLPPLSPEIPFLCEAGEPWLLGVKGAPANPRIETILNQGRTVTSTLALNTIRERVRALMAEQGNPEWVADFNGQFDTAVDNAGVVVDPSAITYRDFLSSSLARGVSMAEAASAWKDHKANLAAEAA